jgi:8-oxo-dGTP diphosphatase
MVLVHEYLGAISYKAGGGKPKVVEFYRMQAVGEPSGKPARDIKAVQWLPLDSAVAKLSLPLERAFLDKIGPRALEGVKLPAEPSVGAEEVVPPQAGAPFSDAPMRPARPAEPVALAPVIPNEPLAPNAGAATAAPARKSLLQLILGAFAARLPDAR